MKGFTVASLVIMTIGVLLFLVGCLFKILHWPDLFQGYYSGPVFIVVGGLLLLVARMKGS